ncbi:MAG TPA: SDR family oxidoreductase [Kiritimatiellia bacterium]|nr:SDR family oxidoreductase [Kiritimatiellia bacterium]
MPSVCLTGASGFLGRELLAALSPGFDVTPVAHRSPAPGMVPLDLRDSHALAAFLHRTQPDILINSAAYRDPDPCEANPDETRRLNTDPLEVMIDHLPPHAKLVQISTDYVFRGDAPPYTETSPTGPVNVYGQTKLDAERIALTRPNSLVIRIPLLIGAGPTPATSGFITQILTALRSRQPQEADHISLRFPTWIRDVAHALRAFLHDDLTGIIHVSSTEPQTRYTLLTIAAELTGLPADHIRPTDQILPRPAPRPANSQLAIQRWQSLGHPPPATFPTILTQTLAEFGGLGAFQT